MIANVSAAARELSARLGSDRVLESGAAYDDARTLWNGAVDRWSALIVRVRTAAEVQAAVRVAWEHHVPLSVRGGGHDWAARALRTGGLVIDLTGMRQVVVDPEARVATVEGGATVRDVTAAGGAHDLVAATGTVGAVGMAGLTLAGGYGPLIGRFGLALDNLLAADVVLADGRLVTVDDTWEPELFWALCGGGCNFGVVTSMRVRLHPIARLLAGLIVFPWGQAADVWRRLSEVAARTPDELTIQSGVIPDPDGEPAVFLYPSWSGDLEQGEKYVNELLRFGTPLISQVAPISYLDILNLFDSTVVDCRHYATTTRSVADYTPDVISALVEAGSSRTSPLSAISVQHFHGAAAQVPADRTAFGLRREHFMVEVLAAWEPDSAGGTGHRAWASAVSTDLAAVAMPGGYPNSLGPDQHDQIAHAYGANASRLLAAKAHYDPDGIFDATPLPPRWAV